MNWKFLRKVEKALHVIPLELKEKTIRGVPVIRVVLNRVLTDDEALALMFQSNVQNVGITPNGAMAKRRSYFDIVKTN